MIVSHKQNESHVPLTPSHNRIMNNTSVLQTPPKTPATPRIANSSHSGHARNHKIGKHGHHSRDVAETSGPSASAAATSSLPKCMCNWKNCRAFQKAFRETKHPTFDGVVKIKLAQDHLESMAYKDCLDRTLGVSKPPEWKKGGDGKVATCKYVVAKHHFTDRHIQKYDLNPKTFSFVKPFSVHGAKKYLFSIDTNETIPSEESGGGTLYMQCPNVPKEVVKQEFQKAMERLRPTSSKKSNQRKVDEKNFEEDSQKEYEDGDDNDNEDDDGGDHNSTGETSQHIAMLKSKEAENKLLKDQLEAMKSQLTFLHDMVIKLQEQHFENASVVSGRSRHSFVGGSNSKNNRKKATKKFSGNTAATSSLSTMNERNAQYQQNQSKNSRNANNKHDKATNGASSPRKGSGVSPHAIPTRRGSIGVPNEINVDGDDVPDMESQTLASNWQEGEGDWTETQDESDEHDDDDEDDDADDRDNVSYADKTVATSQTFKTKYKLRPGEEPSDDEEEDDEEDDYDLMSLAAMTLVSASKSVKTLPREIELDEDDSDTHESLEEEAFDLRSFASRGSHSVWKNMSTACDSSYSGQSQQSSRKNSIIPGSQSCKQPNRRQSLEVETSDVRSFASRGSHSVWKSMSPACDNSYSSQQSSRKNSIMPGSRNAMSERSNHSVGASCKKPNRRQSFEKSQDNASVTSSVYHGAGTDSVTNMGVTDPYGENGSYTGTICKSTGMPHGYGRLEYERAGRWYEGDWKQGRWTGKGRLSNGDGDLYEGGLKNDHKHGFGTMRFADGRTFVGEYNNGQMVEGLMTYHDGSTYDGHWEDGMRHGHGICVFTDNSVYQGQFKEGEFFGYGKMTWNDGGWYEGEWLNGEMHGRGREVRADGSLRHDGEWIKGQPLRNNRPVQPQPSQSQQSKHRWSVAPV